MGLDSPDYTMSSGHRSHFKGHSPYKKFDFSAQIVGSNPTVQWAKVNLVAYGPLGTPEDPKFFHC